MSTAQAKALRLATVLLALVVAFSQSYHALALRALEWAPWPLAWTYPLSVDGLILAAMLAIAVLGREKQLRRRAYGWAVLALGLAVSLLGNAPPGLVPGDLIVLRVFPPASLALSLHLAIMLGRADERRAARKLVERPVEHSPEQAPALALLPAAASGPSKSERARRLIAEARTEGRALDVLEIRSIAKQAELAESSVRRLAAESANGRAQAFVS